MNKLPAIQFYFGDWKKDANLAMCSLSTRGFWHEILGAMHELGRSGQITGTAQQLGRVCRCTAAEAEDAIKELRMTRAADVSERDGVYTLINRRMKREYDDRKSTNERVARHRKGGNATNGNANVTGGKTQPNKGDKAMKRESNANVTPLSSSSSSITKTQSGRARDELPDHLLPDNLGDYRQQLERWYCTIYGVNSFPPDKNTVPQTQWLFEGKFTLADIKAFYEYATTHPDQIQWRRGEVNLGAIVKGIADWRKQKKAAPPGNAPDYSKCPDCLGTGMITLNRKDAKICTHAKLLGQDST